MNWTRCAILLCCSVLSGWAQCPPSNFVQGGEAILSAGGAGSVAGLQRQTDGSFTRQRYNAAPSYNRIDSVPGYQSVLVNCTPAAPRTFHLPSGWTPFADQTGTSSLPLIFTDLGLGTPAGVAATTGGYPNGPAFDAVTVALTNPDGSLKSVGAFYAVPGVVSVLAADFNHDGKKDIAAVSNTGNVYILLGNGDGSLKTGVKYGVDQNPVAAVAYDFNGDGYPDLAVLNNGTGDVSILINKGDGTFKPVVNYLVGALPLSIAVGDFNGDGHADIVTGTPRFSGNAPSLAFLNGNGDGTFGKAAFLQVQFTAYQLAVGDFNKDGKPDLAAVDLAAVILLTGDGKGGFSAENDYAIDSDEPGVNPGLMAMDLDGDGNLDVVLAAGHPDVLAPNLRRPSVLALFGRGDGTLIGPSSYAAGNSVAAIVSADFNNDGKLDLAVASSASHEVRILLGAGNGTFKPPIVMTIQGPSFPVSPGSLVARDFNGDKNIDLVVADLGGDSVYVLLGKGDGTFQAAVRYPTGDVAAAVATADFNGDGKLDLVVSGPSTSNIVGAPPKPASMGILLGNGDGTFQAVKLTGGAGNNPAAIVTGDFNNDGKADVALLNSGTADNSSDPGGLLIFLGQGNGSFQSPTNYLVGYNPSAIAVGDLNGDGAPDLAVTSTGPDATGAFIGLLLNKGNGTFAQSAPLATAEHPHSIAIGDVNLDGKPDLVIGHCCGEVTHATTMAGVGDGTFQAEQVFSAAVSSYTLALADVNGDGSADLISGTFLLAFNGVFSSTVGVFPNTSAPQTPLSAVVSPASGSGQAQSLTFTFNSTSGWQNLQVVDVLINSALDGRHACYVAFVPAAAGTGSVYLVDDAGDAGGPYQGLQLPATGSIANSQCGISGAGSSVSGSGTTLTLTLAITFSSSFTGNKIFYLSAQDKSGNNSGWLPMGTWAVPATTPAGPSVGGVSPGHSSTASQTYTFTFNDTKGWQDLTVVNILVNGAIDGRKACYVAFVPASGALYLVDNQGDAAGPYSGTVLPGTGTVSNSQCSIAAAGSSVSGTGNTLTLALPITFSQSFAGNRVIYLAARNNTASSDWQPVGTVIVP